MLPSCDITELKSAYKEHRLIATLADGREIVRRKQYRFNSCYGCVFAHSVGCYCENGEIWIDKKTYEDEND